MNDNDAAKLEQDEFHSQIFRHLSEGINLVRMSDGIIIYTNEIFDSMFGYEKDELIGKHVSIINATSPQDTSQTIKHALQETGQWKGTVQSVKKDGTMFWCQVNVTQFNHAEFGPVGISLHQDIDERIKAIEKMQETERLYSSLVNTLPFNVYRIDLVGRLTFVNKTLLDNLGASEEEVIGKTAYDFYPEEHAQKYRKDDKHVVESGETLMQIEENISPLTQEKQYVEVIKIPIFDTEGKVVGIQGIFSDITQRIENENKLRQQAIWSQYVSDAIISFDTNVVITNWNQAATRIYGWSAEEAIGNDLSTLLQTEFTTTQRDEILAQLRDIGTWRGELIHKTKSEEKIVVDTAITWQRDQDNNNIGGIAVNRDITKQKQSEQQQLEFRLEKERMNILSHFITQASHEFRTPLSIINTSTYLLSKGHNDEEFIQRHVERINRETDNITTLITDLAMMTELDTKDMLTTYPIDIQDIIATLNKKNIILELEETPLTVRCDPFYLTKALQQLIDNARQYTKPDDEITIQLSQEGNHACIAISDEGIGISEGDLPHVFKRFYRRDNMGTTRGFGLGLPIVKTIVEKHNGTIEVKSAVDQGTTVSIYLPIYNNT